MCDVTSDAEITKLFEAVEGKIRCVGWIGHSVGVCTGGRIERVISVNTTREGFRIAHDVSVYSLIAVAGSGALDGQWRGIVTLTYYGAEKVVPKYKLDGRGEGGGWEATVRYLANDLGPKGIR